MDCNQVPSPVMVGMACEIDMHQLNPRVDCLPASLTIRSSKPTLVRGGRRPRQRTPAPGFLLFFSSRLSFTSRAARRLDPSP